MKLISELDKEIAQLEKKFEGKTWKDRLRGLKAIVKRLREEVAEVKRMQ